jgi:hypothetical protein
MNLHVLKTWPEFFQAMFDGSKCCDVRKNDRGFLVGDVLLLCEWNPTNKSPTGRKLLVKVIHILKGGQFGIDPDYVVMSVVRIGEPLEVKTFLPPVQFAKPGQFGMVITGMPFHQEKIC